MRLLKLLKYRGVIYFKKYIFKGTFYLINVNLALYYYVEYCSTKLRLCYNFR